jgi:DNA polymerase III subunit delta
MHGTAFLKEPDKHETGPMVVLTGTESTLKQDVVTALSRAVVPEDDDDDDGGGGALTRFAGKDTEFKTVRDELLTVSMWGDARQVLIEDADPFVTANRSALEAYVAKPAKKSLLILDVGTWRSNTRLAKTVKKVGLTIECTPLKGATLLRWVQDTAGTQYGKQLSRDAANLLIELAGSSLGLLDREVAKLAAYVGENARIGLDEVRTLVGGWKAETTWTMVDALKTGNLGLALECLEKLLVAGEPPQRILGGINSVFRKLFLSTELARQGMALNAALKQAGVFPRDINSSNQYLRRIGRPRAEKLSSWLLQADSNLKGGSRLSDRLQLEQLLVRLSGRT